MLVPRFSTNSSRPASTAAREHAELMTPLPPMNKILGFVMLQRYWAVPGRLSRLALPEPPAPGVADFPEQADDH